MQTFNKESKDILKNYFYKAKEYEEIILKLNSELNCNTSELVGTVNKLNNKPKGA